jgi:N-acyl-D-amino-acid deacylase
MSPYRGLYITHMRYKKGLLEGLREAVEIARRADVPLHVSHLKPLASVQLEELLDYIDRVATNEVDFSFDVYPYMPGSTALNSLLPYEAWEDGPLGVVGRLRQPALRERFAELLADYQLPLDGIKLAWVPGKANAEYQGLTLGEYVRRSGRSAADALVELLIEEQLAALAVFHIGDDRLVEPMLTHPRMMLGSDGIYQPGGAIHPRAYGSAPRMLGPLVRDRKLFPLETAVRKLSGYPAERFGLKDRGLVQEGRFADLTVFDPAAIADRATYDQPHQPAAGIHHVLVNGTPIIADGRPVDLPAPELPGRKLKFHG